MGGGGGRSVPLEAQQGWAVRSVNTAAEAAEGQAAAGGAGEVDIGPFSWLSLRAVGSPGSSAETVPQGLPLPRQWVLSVTWGHRQQKLRLLEAPGQGSADHSPELQPRLVPSPWASPFPDRCPGTPTPSRPRGPCREREERSEASPGRRKHEWTARPSTVSSSAPG